MDVKKLKFLQVVSLVTWWISSFCHLIVLSFFGSGLLVIIAKV